MKYYVVAVRDRAADCYAVPNFVASIGGAIRGFADEINRSAADNMFFNHPEDFDLYQLGTYDDADGSFEVSAPHQIVVGKDLKIKK